jgi:hypothetical protein
MASGEQTARLHTDRVFDQILEIVLADAVAQGQNPVLRLAYTEAGEEVAPEHDDAIRDLKPPPAVARALLARLATSPRRTSGLVAGLVSEFAQDKEATKTKPTALNFTAGQQRFLDIVDQVRMGTTRAALTEALLGKWTYSSKLPSLRWGAAAELLHALRARAPADDKEKPGGMPAAEWLGVLSLEYFPVFVRDNELRTAAVSGYWKSSTFRWPLWEAQATRAVIAGLLRIDCRRWSTAEQSALGIFGAYSAEIRRQQDGKSYGNFSPVAVVLPRRG